MLRPVLSVLLAAAALGGCSSGSPSSSPSSSTSPSTSPSSSSSDSTPSPAPAASPSPTATPARSVPKPPRRAACYRLSRAQLSRPTNDSSPVACSGRHNARTIHVGRLDTVVDGHSVAVDSATVQRQLASTCPRRLASYLGGTAKARNLSRFEVVWYSPTLAQSDQGADWFRCDLVAFAGTDSLLALPARGVKGVLGRPGALDTYGLCGTSAPAADGFARVICSRRHSWRAFDTVGLPGGRRYPGAAALRKAGQGTCSDRARSRADDPLKFRFGWEWPTAEQWAAGQRFGYCWAPD